MSFPVGLMDGAGTNALFGVGIGLALDPTGSVLYSAEYQFNVLRQINLSSTPAWVSTYAFSGNATTAGSRTADGTGTIATITRPTGLAFDSNGHLFISQSTPGLLRQLVEGTKCSLTPGLFASSCEP
jgi:hypothetical protein